MGREIRRVPPNWQHPKKRDYERYLRTGEDERYVPMFDQDVQSAFEEWVFEYADWCSFKHDEKIAEYGEEQYPKNETYRSFCSYHGEPPNPENYRPKFDESTATWYQVYETVTEGTPVSPPFATTEELIDYLVENGDFWDQKRGDGGWSRESATRFVTGGFAPSLVVTQNTNGSVSIIEPRNS